MRNCLRGIYFSSQPLVYKKILGERENKLIYLKGATLVLGTVSLFLVMKALILIAIMVFLIELIHIVVAQKALNLEEFSMDKAIFRIFTGISNAFVAFTINIAAGALLFLLSI